MTSKILKFSFISIISFSISSFGQSLLGSQFPQGIPTRPATGPSLSLEGTGIGIQNDLFGMVKNPANLGGIQRAVFSASASLDFLNLHDNGMTSNFADFNPLLLSLGFPIGKFGALDFSIDQRTNNNLNFRLTQQLDLSPTFDAYPDTAQIGIVQNGGTSVWQVGWGYTIKKRALVGLSYERVYFSSYSDSVLQVGNETVDSSKVVFQGNGIRGGVMVPIKKLTLGITGEYILQNKSNSKHELIMNEEDTISTNKTFTFQPAPSLGFGASYQITPEWLAAADLDVTFWDHFHSSLPTMDLRNKAVNFSAGGQFIPAPNLLAPKYFEIMQYRAGFRYTQLPSATASEFAFSLGTGFPIEKSSGLIDFIFEYGRRWDTQFNNYNENFVSIKLGINGGRKWYQSSDDSY